MTLSFPSREFDDVVAAACHGVATAEQIEALAGLLRASEPARDEYIRRVSLHAYIASEPNLFAPTPAFESNQGKASTSGRADDCRPRQQSGAVANPAWSRAPSNPSRSSGMPAAKRRLWSGWPRKLAVAAAALVLLGGVLWLGSAVGRRRAETSRAVAILNRVVNARWNIPERLPPLGAPLEPGLLRLESGLAQIVFYNGARVVIEGPSEFRLISATEAECVFGTLTAEVPPQARGFRVRSPRLDVTDLGTAFGLKVGTNRSELHVFEGHVEYRQAAAAVARDLAGGNGARVEGEAAPTWIAADRAGFAELFDLQAKSVAADARRYDQWRESVRKLRRDPSLWVHLDFEHGGEPAWRLPNSGSRGKAIPDATIVGCEWREGRWATKPALEFRGIGDRVRLHVPGELESVTLAAWVRVQGLDRQINSLFMSDGLAPGTLHWVIRNDGVLGLTAFGTRGAQILATPRVLTIDQFGIWTHLAVTLDGPGRQVVHYVNGRPVSRQELRMAPPFRVGVAELGNWAAHVGPGDDPFLIRNFSGAMDEFCLFNRALTVAEIRSLYEDGRPQPEPMAALHNQSNPARP